MPPAGGLGMELCGIHSRRPRPVHLSLCILPAPTLRPIQDPRQNHTDIHTLPIRHLCSPKGGGCLGDIRDRPGVVGGGELPGHLLSGGWWE